MYEKKYTKIFAKHNKKKTKGQTTRVALLLKYNNIRKNIPKTTLYFLYVIITIVQKYNRNY